MAEREILRVLVVDDEPAARRGVRSVLDGWSSDLVIEECRNGEEAVRALRQSVPDIVLLDVQMPGLDGFEVIREVGVERMPAVVFVTAYDDHALRAFDVAAVDYVVKPFTDERLRQAMERALRRRSERRAAEVQQQLLALLEGTMRLPGARTAQSFAEPLVQLPAVAGDGAGYLNRLLVTVGSRSEVIPVSTITWIRSDDYYASVFADGTAYLIRETLAELERRLDPREFIRVHRSAIVRLAMVRSLERPANGRYRVVLRDGTRVPVSRSRHTAVARTLGDLRG